MNPPFFIVGCPRSGTTLVQQMLSAHPDVTVTPETFFVRRHLHPIRQAGGSADDVATSLLDSDVVAMAGLSSDDVRAELPADLTDPWDVLRAYLSAVASRHGSSWVGEKTPNHALFLPELAAAFPSAKFVHLVRDPRAVATSWRDVPWSSGSLAGDTAVWRRYERAVAAAALPADRLRTVAYEDLLRQPDVVLPSLLAWLGVPWHDAVLAHDEQAPAIDVDEPWKARSRRPLDPSRIDRWRDVLTDDDVARIEASAGKELRRHGYVPESTSVRRLPHVVGLLSERVQRRTRRVLTDRNGTESRAGGVGHLHLGHGLHGIRRYSETLADSVGALLPTTEHAVDLAVLAPRAAVVAAWQAGRRLRACDVVHVQWNTGDLWGGWPVRMATLVVFLLALGRRPTVVVTLHDVHTPLTGRRRLHLRLLDARAARLVVSSAQEHQHVERVTSTPCDVVPHYVEAVPTGNPDNAEQEWSLDDHRVVLLLGFVHRRKGHHHAVAALRLLPPDILMVIAGAAARHSPEYLASLLAQAETDGTRDRLRHTGPLTDEQLADLLARADVGLCPYARVAASGSMATMVGAGLPVIATSSPYLDDLREHVPAGIRELQDTAPETIARAIEQALDPAVTAPVPPAALAVPAIAQRLVEVYASAAPELRSADAG